MQNHLEEGEIELLTLTKTVMNMLSAMNDWEFESITDELIADDELVE
jgi:hypothetical protein